MYVDNSLDRFSEEGRQWVRSEHITKGGNADTSQKEIATELAVQGEDLVELTRWKCVEKASTSH